MLRLCIHCWFQFPSVYIYIPIYNCNYRILNKGFSFVFALEKILRVFKSIFFSLEFKFIPQSLLRLLFSIPRSFVNRDLILIEKISASLLFAKKKYRDKKKSHGDLRLVG